MTDAPRGFYVRYIERLIDANEKAGTQAPDSWPPEYWAEWRANHEAASRHDELQDNRKILAPECKK
jgi:hypothetical protein